VDDTRYPPKNRPEHETGLGPVDIEVVYDGGTLKTDPNGSIAIAIAGQLPEAVKPLAGLRSVLSGRPAVLYRTIDVEIALAEDEVIRLMGRELQPAEHRQLLEHFGDFFEIHGDYYDFATGAALQPLGDRVPLRDGFDASDFYSLRPSTRH
jgi:hypothetical protein